jgi:hypothetical protein
MANDAKRVWGAVAGILVAAALIVRVGGIVVTTLAGSEKLDARWAHCETGRYGPGPCVKGPLLDVVAASVISVILLVIILGCLRVIWRVRWERRLRAHGARVSGVVVASTRLTPPNRRRPVRFRIRVEVPAVPGIIALTQMDSALPSGTSLTVAYDPAHPRRRGVVIDEHAS